MPIDTAFTRDRARDRQEDRRVEVFNPAAALKASEWAGLLAWNGKGRYLLVFPPIAKLRSAHPTHYNGIAASTNCTQ